MPLNYPKYIAEADMFLIYLWIYQTLV